MAGLLVKWTKVMINSNKNDITTCPQIGNIQVDLGDIQDSQFCTHIPQIKAVCCCFAIPYEFRPEIKSMEDSKYAHPKK